MTNKDAALAVLELVRYISGQANVDVNDRIYHDLRVRGEDAWELFTGLNQRFGTDFSELNLEKYFPDEHPSLWVRLRELCQGSEKAFVPMRVAELIEAVRDGRWVAKGDLTDKPPTFLKNPT